MGTKLAIITPGCEVFHFAIAISERPSAFAVSAGNDATDTKSASTKADARDVNVLMLFIKTPLSKLVNNILS